MPDSWHQKAEEEPPSRFRAVFTRKFPSAPGVASHSASSLRVTEEAGKLSEKAQRLHPEIEWRGIVGMRNYLAHDYGNVDRAVVWDAVTSEFPALAAACRQIIEES